MAAQLTPPLPLYSTAQMWLPATRRGARRCSMPARLEASCAPTSSSSMAAQGKAAAQPPPPVRPPLPALPPRPAPAAGVAPPAWAAPTPPLRWYSCPAGETPPLPHGPGTTAPGGPLDRCTAPTHLSTPHPAPWEHFSLSLPSSLSPFHFIINRSIPLGYGIGRKSNIFSSNM